MSKHEQRADYDASSGADEVEREQRAHRIRVLDIACECWTEAAKELAKP